ncbi:amino acid ABC transporter permease [Alkalihalobacillus sp. AL-G]|uniref:amino acid ABC transporter permease n=1 Tax=Alkalihalobacillus sp. AL-G TaxID=2926399 RepID=UPI00272B41E3|nr:amino acid ABC transporter permease [Alkalihalobacillus sp. AL-G]WLD94898.1 amino acid ABC transporter permease [Alkalihalobacillus sp. AL-G]
MDFRFDIIKEYGNLFLEGTLLTIGLSLAGIFIGLILGLFIGIGKLSKRNLINMPLDWYITFFRGTPLFVQILLIHFGVVPFLIGDTNAVIAGIASLSLNAAAYIAEIFRAGIQSIDKGQMEAARSLGMKYRESMRYVILPQAVKRMIPPLGNEFVVLIKESSLLAVIAVPEIMYWGRAMQGQYYRVWEPYLTVALIYLVLTLTLSKVLSFVERKWATE